MCNGVSPVATMQFSCATSPSSNERATWNGSMLGGTVIRVYNFVSREYIKGKGIIGERVGW